MKGRWRIRTSEEMKEKRRLGNKGQQMLADMHDLQVLGKGTKREQRMRVICNTGRGSKMHRKRSLTALFIQKIGPNNIWPSIKIS